MIPTVHCARHNLAAWGVVLAIGMAGCTSLEPPHGPRIISTSTSLVIVGADMQVVPLSPTETVQYAINEMLDILGDEALRRPGLSQERRQQIEHVIRHRVDSEEMAHRSLGAPWSRLSVTERTEYVNLFVALIRDLVANKVKQYYDALYLIEQREGSFAEVRTLLLGTKVDTTVNFRLNHHSADWLIYDMVVDGVSIAGNYRAQFGRIIRDYAHAGLVEKMKQRALTVKGFEKTAPAPASVTMDTDYLR